MKRFLAFFLFFIMTLNVHAEKEVNAQMLYAKSAVLMDAKSGRILYKKNGNEIMAMASTTKIITCIIALEEGNLQDIVTVSELAAAQPKVHLGMNIKEQFYLRDLLYSLMLESHNDSAVAIAEHIDGSVEAFARRMNDKAKELGCENTYFLTPNGLDKTDENGFHSTTAEELARIMKYCICESSKKDLFLEITSELNYKFTNIDKSRTFSCVNRNSFLNMMEGAISGKTGFTGKAGYCYVGALERDGRTFIVALLACGWPNNKNYKWEDSKLLMEYALKNYNYKESEEIVLPKIKVVGGITSKNDIFEDVYTSISTDRVNLLVKESEEIHVITKYEELLQAPIKKGDEIGSVKYYINETFIEEQPIVINETIERKTLQWYWSAFLNLYLL